MLDDVAIRLIISVVVFLTGYISCWWGGNNPNDHRRVRRAMFYGGLVLIGLSQFLWWWL